MRPCPRLLSKVQTLTVPVWRTRQCVSHTPATHSRCAELRPTLTHHTLHKLSAHALFSMRRPSCDSTGHGKPSHMEDKCNSATMTTFNRTSNSSKQKQRNKSTLPRFTNDTNTASDSGPPTFIPYMHCEQPMSLWIVQSASQCSCYSSKSTTLVARRSHAVPETNSPNAVHAMPMFHGIQLPFLTQPASQLMTGENTGYGHNLPSAQQMQVILLLAVGPSLHPLHPSRCSKFINLLLTVFVAVLNVNKLSCQYAHTAYTPLCCCCWR